MLDPHTMTLSDILRQAAARYAKRQIVFAQRSGEDSGYGYAELYRRARQTLAWLQQHGVQVGDRLVVQCASSQRQIELFWACVLGGVVPVLLPKVVSWRRESDLSRKLDGVTRVLGGPWVVADADQEAAYRTGQAAPVAHGSRWLIDDPQAGDARLALEQTRLPEDLAYLQFSSGSTGLPKGVRLTHRNLCCNVREIADTVKALPTESTLSWMPYYHDMGLIAFHLVPLYRGMGQVKLEAAEFIAEPLFWLRKIHQYHAEVISSPNFGLQHVIDRITPEELSGLDLSCVRLLCNGAEPISAQVMRRFCDLLAPLGFRRHAMFPVYGMAEACVAVTFSPIHSEPRVHSLDRLRLAEEGVVVTTDDVARRIEYVDVGFPLPSVELRVVDEAGQICVDRSIGEVQIRGTNVTAGYEGLGEVNQGLFTADGWLHTGDLGFLDEGRLTIAGRLKDVIFINGRNVMAADLERHLALVFELKDGGIAACAASDPQTGREQVMLFVAARKRSGLQEWLQQIRQTAAQWLGYPVAGIIPLARLPRTSSGKLQRYQLTQEWLAGAHDALLAESAAAGLERPLPKQAAQQQGIGQQGAQQGAASTSMDGAPAQAVRRIWAQVLRREETEIPLDASFAELGGTSVKAIEMLARLEEHFGRVYGYALLLECSSIQDIVAYIAQADHPQAAQASARNQPAQEAIAIIGYAARFPGGADVHEFWQTLISGRSVVAPVAATRWQSRQGHYSMGALADVDQFAADFFGIGSDEAQIMDPQQRLMLEVAYAAMEDAGYTGTRLDARRAVGVFLGASSNSYMEEISRRRSEGGQLAHELRHSLLMPANLLNIIAARVSHALNLKGPALTVDTACSSALVALQQACDALRLGHCEMALAGGVSLLLTATAHELFDQAGALSADGVCRAFDAAANGMVPGEGLGLVVLKPLSRALADGDRIEAVIDAVAVNNDGRSIGIMAPTPEGQEAVLRAAFAEAGIAAAQISYVEAHGTGTPIGDPIEVRALARAYGPLEAGHCAIGSVKTNIGHLLAAAGIAGLIKVLLALRHERLPASLNLEKPHPLVRFERTPFVPLTESRPWPRGTAPRYAGISAFGFGGTNAHVIVHDLPQAARTATHAPLQAGGQLLTLSARSGAELQRLRSELASHLRQHPDISLLDLCYSRAAGRAAFGLRESRALETLDEAIGWLETARPLPAELPAKPATGLAFVFSGQGAQHVGMGAALYGQQPIFAAAFDRCVAQLHELTETPQDWRGWLLDGRAEADWLQQPGITQPLLFAIEYALAELWQACAVKPQLVAGHSLGEYAAAVVAGVMTLADALRLVVRRAALLESVRDGTMLSVALGESTLLPLLASLALPVDLAAVNGADQCVVAGSRTAVIKLKEALQARRVAAVLLPMQQAYHSRQMQPLLAAYREVLAGVELQAPRLPFLTSIHCEHEVHSPEYWLAHLTQPVRYADTITRLAAREDVQGVLEIGPGRLLSQLNLRLLQGTDKSVWASQSGKTSRDGAAFLQTLGELWQWGLAIDWQAVFARRAAQIERLPSYPHTRQRYWLPTQRLTALPRHGQAGNPPAERNWHTQGRPASDWCYLLDWQVEKAGSTQALPAHVCLLGADDELMRQCAQRLQLAGVGVDTAPLPVSVAAGVHLLQRLATQQPWLVDLGCLQGLWCAADDAAAWQRHTEEALLARVHLAQAMAQCKSSQGWQWLLCSRGALALPGEACQPTASAVQALALSLALEVPALELRCVDLASCCVTEDGWAGPTAENMAGTLLSELAASIPAQRAPARIAWRNDKRLLGRVLPLPATEGMARLSFKRGGRYLISGGFGGIAMQLADYLSRRHDAQVILLGRCQPLPGTPAAALLARLAQAYPKLIILEADLGDEAALVAAMTALAARIDGLDGVVHAAGSLQAAALAELDAANLRCHLVPKLAGTVRLVEHTRALNPAWHVMFSSLIGVQGGATLAGYAAANAFLDGYAHYLRAQGHMALSVAWGYWGEIGMSAGHEVVLQMAQQGLFAMGHRQALMMLERVLASGETTTLVTNCGSGYFARLGFESEFLPLVQAVRQTPISDDLLARLQHMPALGGLLLSRLDQQLADLLAGTVASDEPQTLEELALWLGATPERQLQLAAALQRLVQAGLLQQRAGGYQTVLPAPEHSGQARWLDELLAGHEFSETERAAANDMQELIRLCTLALPAALRGEAPQLKPDLRAEVRPLVERLRTRWPSQQLGQQYLLALLAAIAESLPANRPLRILEIGAGCGALTLPVLQLLNQRIECYHATDADALSLDELNARLQQAGHAGLVSTRLLDLRDDATAQGLPVEYFDVVLAAAGIHQDAGWASLLVRGLLRPGGQFLLLTAVRATILLEATQGLLEDWWTLTDGLGRPGYPLLNTHEWQRLLKSEGYQVACLPVARPDLRVDTELALFLARVPGQLISATPPPAPLGARRRASPADSREEQLACLIEEACVASGIVVPERGQGFASLGVDSLSALKVGNCLQQQLGVQLPASLLFEYDSVERLAQFLAREEAHLASLNAEPPGAPATQLMPLPAADDYELSLAQQRLWFLEQLTTERALYNVPCAVSLTGPLLVEVLTQVFNTVVARHESLRTTFVERAGEPRQRILESLSLSIPLIDLCALGGAEQSEEVARHISRDARAAFDLAQGPLIRATLLRLSAQHHVLLLNLHHLISDGWSLGVLVREVATLYADFMAGRASSLPPLKLQYKEYAVQQRRWLQGALREDLLSYWREQLRAAPALLELPTDRPRPALQSYRGARLDFRLDAALSAALTGLAREHNATQYMVLLAAFQWLLARYSGQDDICVGSPVANREQPHSQELIGFFVNTLVLRSRVDGRADFLDFLAQVRQTTLGALAHQALPFDQLVEALQPQRNLAHSPLFQVLFVLQTVPPQELAALDLHFEQLPADSGTAQYDLTLSMQAAEEGMTAFLEYNTDLFERASMERLAQHFLQLLGNITTAPARCFDEFPWLDDAQREQQLCQWNDTAVAFDEARLFHELFEERAAQQPEALALSFAQDRLSYGELNARANRLAHHLRSHQVAPDALIAVCVERGMDMVVSLLAVLKAGAAYLPIDASLPAERIAYMLEDARPRVIITQEALLQRLPPAHQADCLVLERARATLAGQPAGNVLLPAARATQLAYVIYTSGSTGRPKGVMLAHRGLVNLAQWQQRQFAVTPDSRVLQFASMSFDACTWELAMALASGASLHLGRREELLPGEALAAFMQHRRITHATLPPVAVSAWPLDLALPDLQTLVVAGEACPPTLARHWSGRCNFFNAYGPTETTVCASIHHCQPEEQGAPPIGQPIANTRLYVLGRRAELLPIGVVGEIYIGGVGLARGYLNQPGLTAERFVATDAFLGPWGDGAGQCLYKTGDLGRWRADGRLEYLGRNDHQVKLRGFRIELGEIEAQLGRLPGVRDAAVLLREDRPGDKRLVAYVTPLAELDELQASALREALCRQLPDYMLPAAFVMLSRLPLTSNGKLDRAALPAPELMGAAQADYVAPVGAQESLLADIWQDILGVARVGRLDNFFDLGGHSLRIVDMLARLKRAGWQAEVRQVFEQPTVAALASVVQPLSGQSAVELPDYCIPPGCQHITPELLPLVSLTQTEIEHIASRVAGGMGNIQDIYPLAPLQEGLLFHHLMSRQSDAYILPILLRLENTARLSAFCEAVGKVIARHDVLRTAILWQELSQPVQVVLREVPLPWQELTPPAGETAETLIRGRMQPENLWLDLQQAPMLHLTSAVDAADGRVYLLLQLHHIIADHVSLELILQEVLTLLAEPQRDLPVSRPYRDFVARARSQDEHRQAAATAHFGARLADLCAPSAPFGLMDVHAEASHIEEAQLRLAPLLAQRLRGLARRLQLSPATLFHVAMAAVVARTSNQTQVVFGSVLSGRLQHSDSADRVLGMFINTLPLRLDVAGQTVLELVHQAQHELLELLKFEQTPLALAQRCAGFAIEPGAGHAPPLFTAMLNYRHSSPLGHQGQGLNQAQGVELLASFERTNYPLTLNVDDLGEDYALVAQCAPPISATRINAYLVAALESLSTALEQSLAGQAVAAEFLDILPAQERQLLLTGFGAPQQAFAADLLLHQTVAEQAARAPQAIALSYMDVQLSYAELDERANRLAHRLLKAGVVPDALVAVSVERGLDMVVALLAILKAGGAYLPLDPQLPDERLAFILADARPQLILTQAGLAARLPQAGACLLCLDELDLSQEPDCTPQVAALDSRNLAYVIYTSGSTGQPKGVMIEHRQVGRLLRACQPWFGFGAHDVWTLFHSYAFDFSVWEIWGALAHGGRLVIVPQEVTRAPQEFYQLLCQEGVTVLNQTPSAFRALSAAQDSLWHEAAAAAAAPPAHRLRHVIFGGEALELHSLKPWLKHNPIDAPRLINMYGITETTVHVTYRPITRDDIERGQASPIGVPIPDLRVLLLDHRLQPVPIGVAGEIHVAGPGLARGYLGRAGLTAERFVANPHASSADAASSRLYRSGDVARWTAEGGMEYLGRNDHQVKIRGYRIELGEIEAQLMACQEVRDAVVVAHQAAGQEAQLVAYVVAQDAVDADALRRQLRRRLPDYMLPAAYVSLAQLPLTANGKLDRRALPAPAAGVLRLAAYAAPVGELEEQIAAIWHEVLQLPAERAVGRHDSFFDLGGHSLLIVQLLERLRRQGLAVSARSVFEQPTPAALAGYLGLQAAEDAPAACEVPQARITADCQRITPELLPLIDLTQAQIDAVVAQVPGGVANIQDIYPLAPLQAGLLFHHQLSVERAARGEQVGDAYILPTLLKIASRSQCQAFIEALRQVVARHDILRTAIFWRAGNVPPLQVVLREVELPVSRFALDMSQPVQAQLEARVAPECLHMDLQRAPLIELQLAEDECSGECYVVLLLHHIISDHVALEILVSEVLAHLAGQQDSLPAAMPYRNFVAQVLAAPGDAALRYFQRRLARVDEPSAPYGVLDVQGAGHRVDEARRLLPAALSARLRDTARAQQISVASLFHSAWALVVAHTTGRDEVVFGSVLSGRLQGGPGSGRMLGMFINTLPLRVPLAARTAQRLVHEVQQDIVDLLGHEQALLATAQQASGVAPGLPLFTSILNYRHSALATPPAGSGIELLASFEHTNYPLAINVDDRSLDGAFALDVQSVPAIPAARVLGYLQQALVALLQALDSSSQRPVLSLPLLPDAELRELAAINASTRDYDRQATIAGRFQAQARRTPQRVAVVQGDESCSYAELDRRSNQLAHYLQGQGVARGGHVGLCLPRSLDMLVGLLAILKTGAAYVPLDPDYPSERLRFMIDDAAPALVLTHSGLLDRLPPDCPALSLDGDWAKVARQPEIACQALQLPDDPIYLIYTSGTTGRPKGAAVRQHSFNNLIDWYLRACRITARDRVLLMSSASFDLSQKNIFAPLLVGGLLVLPQESYEPRELVELIDRHAVTLINCAPSAFQPLLQIPAATRLASLRELVLGGEPLRLSDLRPWLASLPGGGPLIRNSYGPTECTDVVAHHAWRLADDQDACANASDTLPIGKPVDNARLYVLDSQLQPVPLGVVGEIWIAGECVGLGYHQRPELTAERFLPDLHGQTPGGLMYRSGDLGRWNARGELEYLGRNDQQVKIRGLRVELGEIEAQLRAQPGLREAVVIAREYRPGEQQLLAYVTLQEQAAFDPAWVLQQLQASLPAHMLPAAIVALPSLPLTPNGKLDRRALPDPDLQLPAPAQQALQGELEQWLATVWQELLGLPPAAIGGDSHFFELGGHSLLAARLSARVRQQLGRDLPLRAIFDQPVLAAYARLLSGSQALGLPPITPRPADLESLPLSWSQQRLWFFDQLMQHGPASQADPELARARSAYHITATLRLDGCLDVAAVQAALDALTQRHESLRTAFVAHQGEARQLIVGELSLPLQIHDLRSLPASQQAAAVAQQLAMTLTTPFDLAAAPLVRACLLQLSDEQHLLALAMHHIISDGWSMSVLTREFAQLYGAQQQGVAIASALAQLPPLPVHYADYALWQQQWLSGGRMQEQLDYWQQRLHGAPALLQLPLDHARPAVQSHAGATLHFSLGTELSQALRRFAQRHELTLFMTLLAGWSLLLGRLAGQEEVVIGVPVANRSRLETEHLIGFFVNTLALRCHLPLATPLAAWLAEVRQQVLSDFAHQELPFEQLVDALQPERSLAHSPLFQTMFALQNTPEIRLDLPDLHISAEPQPRSTAHFDVTLLMSEQGEDIVAELEYCTALFAADSVARWVDYWRSLLSAMVKAVDTTPLYRLPLMETRLTHQLLHDYNASARDFPHELCFHEVFEGHVERQPQALALSFGGVELSYLELNGRANQLARELRRLGVGPDVLVAISLERSLELMIAVLACFKAGGAYVPIDPAYPLARKQYMLEDARPAVLIGSSGVLADLPVSAPLNVLDVQADAARIAQHARDNLAVGALGLTPGHLAYVIYTSGSTGNPKGVMLAHRGLVSLACAERERLQLGADSRVLQFASFSFDASVWEMSMAWSAGASLHLASREDLLPGAALVATLQRQRISHALLAPVVLSALPDTTELPDLRVLLVGGEACSRALVERWAAGRRMFNAYGPTEATICVSLFECHPGRQTPPPIGRALANTRLYLLDGYGQPVPPGVAGEIHVAGLGLARGYLNRPELTGERFVANHLSGEGGRLYRTGDLGRWNAEGDIEYLGRNDHQVKLRGLRIELGEIEAALLRCPGVCEAVVLVHGAAGQQCLLAWLTAQQGARLEAASLRAALRATLPDYMLPSQYIELAELPQTANGKLDRERLLTMTEGGLSTAQHVAPVGELEQALAALWQDILQLPAERLPGRADDFFALGGHSLLAVQLAARIQQQLGRELSVRDIFAAPSLQDQAQRLAQALPADQAPLLPVARNQALPLSWSQQRLWFIDQLEGAGAAYYIPGALRLVGALDLPALQAALDEIMARHEVLRTRFVSTTGSVIQVIEAPGAVRFELQQREVSAASEAQRHAEVDHQLARFACLPFDLVHGPLVRGLLLKLSAKEHVLCVVMHHIVSDGWSVGVLLREFATLYAAFRQAQPSPLAPLPLQYADYAVWQRQWLSGARLEAQLDWWRQQLAGAPALLELPTDHARPAMMSHSGSVLHFELGAELTARLQGFARAHGMTLFMTLYAAWALLLGRLSGQDEVVIGVPVANRQRSEVEGLIGFFVNTLALRCALPEGQRLNELLQQVRRLTLDAFAHQEVPFEQVVEVVKPPRSLSHSPVFQTLFALQNTPATELVLPGLSISPVAVHAQASQFDLSLMLREEALQGICGELYYATELFEAATLERWLGYYRTLLSGMLQAQDALPLAHLPLLDEAAQRQQLATFNATQVSYPQDVCLHTLIEAQVERTPQAVALRLEDQQLSYRQLNSRANQLAHQLLQLGVAPDSLVAVSMERSFELVVSLLAILKAGAAYVPVDPAYPPERISYMLQDAAPAVLLTQRHCLARLPQLAQTTTLVVDEMTEALLTQPTDNPVLAQSSARQLAYVIYTSGSTGQPKGAMNEHRAVVNRLLWMQDQYRLTAADRVLQKTPFSFDVSVWEFFWPLMCGAELVLARPLGHQDPAYLRQLIGDAGITTLHFVPSMLQVFIEQPGAADCQSITRIVTSGEELPLALARRTLQILPQAGLHNLYGPTEAAIDVTHWSCRANEALTRVPIGHPIANIQMHVLDGIGRPVPVGVAGEIHIGGVGVARGYLKRPELTAERFVADPYSLEPGARLYKTGDLGRWRADGAIEYLGRNDHQVKLRGFRIELGEIEAQLLRNEEIREACVLAREDQPGDKQLVAYVTLRQEAAGELDIERLKSLLRAELPDYMVPAAYVVLEAMPLSPNGKLERRLLPAPAASAWRAREYEAPQGEVESYLVGLWQEVLQLGDEVRIGRHDDFFDLGGHSLKATQILLRLNDHFALKLELAQLFQTTTIAGLAELIMSQQLAQFDAAEVAAAMAELDALSEEELLRLLAQENE